MRDGRVKMRRSLRVSLFLPLVLLSETASGLHPRHESRGELRSAFLVSSQHGRVFSRSLEGRRRRGSSELWAGDGKLPPGPIGGVYIMSQDGEMKTPNLFEDARDFFRKITRPDITRFPPRRMEQEFAVLLMRSSYNATDEMDFVPMDEFQKDQFLKRQAEWEGYKDRVALADLPMIQGDLPNPLYLDFMSYIQYHTIEKKMRPGTARQKFFEKNGAEGTVSVVQRPPSLEDDRVLPREFLERVGDRLLRWMVDKYNTSPNKRCCMIRFAKQPSLDFIVSNLKQIGEIFVQNGYCDKVVVQKYEDLFSPKRIRFTSLLPATLWSYQVLKGEESRITNDFDARVVMAYLRKCGVKVRHVATVVDGREMQHDFTLIGEPSTGPNLNSLNNILGTSSQEEVGDV